MTTNPPARTPGRLQRAGQCNPLLFLFLLTTLLFAAPGMALAQLKVAVMPSYPNFNKAYGNAQLGVPVAVWGRAWGGTSPYTYSLDRGDGSSVPAGTPVSNPAFIGGDHTYTTPGPKTMTLTVRDATGATVTKTATIRVFTLPAIPTGTDLEIKRNIAIERGLLWLYQNHASSGDEAWWNNDGVSNSGEWHLGPLGFQILAFEENGHKRGNNYEADIYAELVQKGLNHMLRYSGTRTVKTIGSGSFYDHSDGIAVRNVDYLNGNGYGAHLWNSGHGTYVNGICGLALALAHDNAAEAQAAIISGGPFNGMSYYTLVQDMIEQFSFSQGDGGSRGGWVYGMTTTSEGRDGSAQQWPALLMRGAKDLLGIETAAWVNGNSDVAFVALQNANGAIGYRDSVNWLNSGKTGGSLVGWSMNGKAPGYAPVDKAIAYLASQYYQQGGWNPPTGWAGYFYSMYGMKKGLSLMGVENLSTTKGPRNWYNDECYWLLGINPDATHETIGVGRRSASYGFGQNAAGSWQGSDPYDYLGRQYATANAILILTPGVTRPVPVAVIDPFADADSPNPEEDGSNDIYDEVKAGVNVNVSGGGSNHTGAPDFGLDQYLWILRPDNGSGSPVGVLNWNSPTGSGVNIVLDRAPADPLINGLLPGVYHLTLRVRDNSNPVQYDETTKVFEAVNKNFPPVAVPIPPGQLNYTGQILPGGQVIVQLDGTQSYDPEGDMIVSWQWSGGVFNNANIATPTITLNSIGATEVTLQVCSRDEFNVVKCSSNPARILVVASDFDLKVTSITAANLNPTVSADLSVQFGSDLTAPVSNVQVQFFNGVPPPYGGSGVALGAVQFVNFTDSGGGVYTASLGPVSLVLGGATEVYVWLDSNQALAEYDETQPSNVGRVNVSNQAPNAVAQNVTVSANGDCQAVVTAAQVNNGSSDPDGDALTFTLSPAGPYALGDNPVTLTVSDGKVTATATATIRVVDNTPPSIACPGDIAVPNDAGVCSATVTYVAPVGTDNCSGATTVQTAGQASGTVFPVGTTLNTFVVTDAVGLTAECSFKVTVTDAEAPQITCPAPITVSNDAGKCGAAVTYAAPVGTDNCPGAVTMQTGGLASGSVFPVGTTVNTFVVTDGAGLTATCSFSVTVTDAEAPQIACPGDIAVNNDAGVCGAVVTYAAPVGTDNCSGATTVQTAGLPSGSVFPIGTTVNTFVVTDAAGLTAECSFRVTVTDNENPVITCPVNKVLVSDSGSCNATGVNLGTPIISDNCPGSTIANNHPSTTYPVGVTTVIWTVTDAAGNTATCTQTVTVVSSISPTLSGFRPPLAGQPVGNKLRRGQVIPHKLALANCAGQTITSGVTVYLNVQGIDSATGNVFQDVLEDAQGVGTDGTGSSDGIMRLTDSQYHFNLDTGNFSDANTLAGTRFYRSTATVVDNATLLVLGTVTINLETSAR